MAEGGATAPADLGIDLGAELDRIEVAVAAGDTDLRSLGFWRIVARVKPDRVLADRFADQIGRIDTAAFRLGVRFRVPVWAGNMLLIGATLGGLAAAILAHIVSSTTLSGLLLLAAGGVWTVSLHSPTHWFVGHLAGIRFTHYFLGRPLPYPGLKSDYSTIATKLAPLLALAFWPGTGAPWWSAAGLVAICLLSIATDVAFSVKVGDWKKFRRERAVAKARASV